MKFNLAGAQAFLPPAPAVGTTAVAKGANQCPRCGLTVYMAEKIVGAGSVSGVWEWYVMGVCVGVVCDGM